MTTYPQDATDWIGKGWYNPSVKEFADRTPPDMDFVDMGPGKAAWIPKNWNPPTLDITPPRPYKVYCDNEGYAVLFRDINGWKHALFTWADGGTTFQWKTAWAAPSDMEAISVPVALLKLADAWLEYLDAAVERETR